MVRINQNQNGTEGGEACQLSRTAGEEIEVAPADKARFVLSVLLPYRKLLDICSRSK